MRLTSRYRFSASHRLDTAALSSEENRKLYGKCNNPHGHGHDYVLEITVDGPVDQSGQVVNREAMDALVRERVLARLDHKNLNDIEPFNEAKNPSAENIAEFFYNHMTPGLARTPVPVRVREVKVWETDIQSATYRP